MRVLIVMSFVALNVAMAVASYMVDDARPMVVGAAIGNLLSLYASVREGGKS